MGEQTDTQDGGGHTSRKESLFRSQAEGDEGKYYSMFFFCLFFLHFFFIVTIFRGEETGEEKQDLFVDNEKELKKKLIKSELYKIIKRKDSLLFFVVK